MEASAAPVSAAEPRGRARMLPPRLLRLASDERLVALVRAGSHAAFEVIYDRHHRGILAFCRHMLASREEAEDAVQHTFMSAYRSLLESEQDMQLRAWLYAIARNRCLSVLRARRERPSDDLEEPATEGLASEVQRRADLRDLLADLSTLPDDQRAALVLSELGDMPHDEICAVLDCPREKVKALVFQARTSLQQSREARETPCEEIRELLSTLTGGGLRRTPLRRHLAACPGCRDFEAEVKRQRRAMAVVLPVIPTLGLKDSALAAAFGTKAAGAAVAGGSAAAAAGAGQAAAGAGAAAGGVAAVGGTSALLAKVLVVAAVASGGSVAGYQAVTSDPPATTPGPGMPAGGPAAPAAAADGEADTVAPGERRSEKSRRRGKDDRGKEWAKGRGKGRKHGLQGTQPRRNGEARGKSTRGRSTEKDAAGRRRGQARREVGRTKGKGTTEARPPKPIKPRPVRPQPAPKRQSTAPAPEPAKSPKSEPTPAPTPAPAPEPEVDAESGDAAPAPGGARGSGRR